jgi:hypothetical protein
LSSGTQLRSAAIAGKSDEALKRRLDTLQHILRTITKSVPESVKLEFGHTIQVGFGSNPGPLSLRTIAGLAQDQHTISFLEGVKYVVECTLKEYPRPLLVEANKEWVLWRSQKRRAAEESRNEQEMMAGV